MTLLTKPPAGASPTPSQPDPDTQPAADRGWFRAFLLRIHFYAGILAGPFLLVAAVSGGLYAMAPQLEQAMYSKELQVPAVTEPLPLSTQVKAAMDHADGDALVTVRPAPGPEDTTRVLFADASLGESQYRTLFVDPGTAEIRGDLPTYGSSGALPVRTWISNLHRSLNLGEPGRVYSELAASWLWVIALGGLLLWIERIRRKRTTKNTAPKPRPATGRARTVWLHGTTGTILLAAFLFLSATGLTWSENAGANVSTLRTALDWTTPTLKTSLTGPSSAAAGDHSGHGSTAASAELPAFDPVMFDTVTRIARADIISAPMIDIKPPAKPGTAWSVTETGREWPASASAVAVDPATGQITSRLDFDDFNPAAKLTRWGIAAHMGLLFGLPNQLALLGIAAGLAAMVGWGYVMWWKRRPSRGSARAFGRPAPRGAFLRGHWAGVLTAITVMVAVGLFLPLLGYSLLAFIALDTLVAEVKRRQRRHPLDTTAPGK
ncbi:putative iron-regulated membrane protein [Arthrobacter ginsengisoli]|uniref:Iron-regulated membrane protein n=1 Tax=Arthrobacter ginsengisoli TaxID=1356565 RepID=A0ABU1UF08_9MICC|nr:PepSY domain-containing protein [Arthrobacter ginsengisoli]MDR7083772.1 putative iron-regulated membrane protein [Arthrobacter ginsengisoli]